MPEKNEGPKAFASLGRAVDKSLGLAYAMRSGKLTRSQFEKWYKKRSDEGAQLIVKIRERTSEAAEPVVKIGKSIVGSLVPPTPAPRPRRSHRRNPRKHSAGRRKIR